MDASTIGASTFIMSNEYGEEMTGAVTYHNNTGTPTATFVPSSELACNTLYTATITTGVTDVAGNALSSDYSWSFTTSPWRIEAVDDPRYFWGFYPRAIAVDTSNHPHAAYGGDHLYYAYHDGSAWHAETVDDSPSVGAYASIALDGSGIAHISYYDEANDDLKYATNENGSWTTTTVDSEGSGAYTSLAVDESGKAHISYRRRNNVGVKYATNASGSWTTGMVDI